MRRESNKLAGMQHPLGRVTVPIIIALTVVLVVAAVALSVWAAQQMRQRAATAKEAAMAGNPFLDAFQGGPTREENAVRSNLVRLAAQHTRDAGWSDLTEPEQTIARAAGLEEDLSAGGFEQFLDTHDAAAVEATLDALDAIRASETRGLLVRAIALSEGSEPWGSAAPSSPEGFKDLNMEQLTSTEYLPDLAYAYASKHQSAVRFWKPAHEGETIAPPSKSAGLFGQRRADRNATGRAALPDDMARTLAALERRGADVHWHSDPRPATDAEIAQLESDLGRPIPAALRRYFTAVNGHGRFGWGIDDETRGALPRLPTGSGGDVEAPTFGECFLSLEDLQKAESERRQVIERWKRWDENDPDLRVYEPTLAIGLTDGWLIVVVHPDEGWVHGIKREGQKVVLADDLETFLTTWQNLAWPDLERDRQFQTGDPPRLRDDGPAARAWIEWLHGTD